MKSLYLPYGPTKSLLIANIPVSTVERIQRQSDYKMRYETREYDGKSRNVLVFEENPEDVIMTASFGLVTVAFHPGMFIILN